MSFYHKDIQSIRSIIWKIRNVFVRQSGKKDPICGGRIDGCSNMTTCPHIHRSLSMTYWSNMQQLSFHSLRTLQVSHQPTSLFPKFKSMLKGCHFESIEAIKTNLLAHLRSIPKTAFQEQRCIQSRGEYFEGDKAE